MVIKPKNWRRFQHYKGRRPPWIKLHRDLLDDYEFACLPVASKALAPFLWLLAAEEEGGEIHGPASRIAFRVRLTEKEFISALVPLIEHGFFDDASNTLATCKQLATPDTDTDTETDTETDITPPTPPKAKKAKAAIPDWFAQFRDLYPERAGDQGWQRALKAANARMAEGHTPDEFIEGAMRYRAFCESTGKLGTEYVKQAASFLGPDKAFALPWSLPKTKAETQQDANVLAVQQWLAQ
jgi:hypothetical protein